MKVTEDNAVTYAGKDDPPGFRKCYINNDIGWFANFYS